MFGLLSLVARSSLISTIVSFLCFSKEKLSKSARSLRRSERLLEVWVNIYRTSLLPKSIPLLEAASFSAEAFSSSFISGTSKAVKAKSLDFKSGS